MNPKLDNNGLRIELLGGLRISGADGEAIELSSRLAGRVLAYLALHLHRKHGREHLVDLFWPDDDIEEGRAKLSKALNTIRGWIAQVGVVPESGLLAGRSEIRLNSSIVVTDASELDEALTAAAQAQDTTQRVRFLDDAVRHYRGELLPGFYDECFDAERNRLSIAFESALQGLVLAHEQLGEIDSALEIALRAVALSPSNEDAHCAVMRLFALRGEPSAVTRQYHELERALEAELGEKPCENTRLLMETLAQSGCETRSARSASLPAQHNLPQPTTRFIGRDKEIAEVKDLLEKSRLLTMTGAGGCGKTRLAYRAVEDLLDQYPDGIWVAELAALSDSGLVPQAVANALRLREQPGMALNETLVEHLKDRSLLLVLDNCEHLLAACAGLADLILRECPRVRILCTSRERLGVPGEQTYRVPSLSLPEQGRAATSEGLSEYEAVRLFVDRAQLQSTSFAITDRNAHALASVCRGLDGIPLAIELAAARVRSMSVEELNQHLDDRFRLLTDGSRTALPRQQTLRALIDWSYDLLNEAEKALLCRLSVFAGGWTVDAAEKVCSGGGVADREVLDVLTSLVDKSLVVTEEKDGATRYSMLETIRQYALDRLQESDDGDAWQDRHLAHFLDLAEEAESGLVGADQKEWHNLLETEHDNLRAALRHSLTMTGDSGCGLRLAGALWRFWEGRGHLTEGRAWLFGLLATAPTDSGGSERAKALNAAGLLAFRQGDYPSARALYEESLAIYRELGDRRGIAHSLNNLGNVACEQGDYPSARALFEESLAIYRELGDRRGIAISLGNLGNVAYDQGDYPSARALYEESLAIHREMGDRWGIAASLNNLGNVACDQGDYPSARALHEESLAIRRELGDQRGIAQSLEGLAPVAAALAEPHRAARIWGAAERLREEIGAPLPPNERPRYERQVATARAALGSETFAAAWAEGRAMSMEQAIDYALADEKGGKETAGEE